MPLGTSTLSANSVREAKVSKRPKGVWLIFGFYLFSWGCSLLSVVLISSGVVTPSPAEKVYFGNLGLLDSVLAFGVEVITLAGAVLLFRLRRNAILVFGLALALNTVSIFIDIATTNLVQIVGMSGLVGMAISWGIMGAVIWYARTLDRQGHLT